MNISINPLYQCNLRCDFCYLGDKLSDPKLLDLEKLDNRLHEIVIIEPIEHVDLYGGEITLLSDEYVSDMFDIIHKYYSGKINIVTNLVKQKAFLLRDDVILSVSYDFDCREAHHKTFNNIISTPKDIHVLVLASKCLIEKNVENMISTFNLVHNIKSVEIKPYSTNQYNQQDVKFTEFEEFVKQWFNYEKRFQFINEDAIRHSLARTRNAFSDDHIYITPSGNFAVLEFDLNDNEFFLELDSYNEYVEWTAKEQMRVRDNLICYNCSYLGHCLSEHLREVKSRKHSCNGFKHLLDWYKNERL